MAGDRRIASQRVCIIGNYIAFDHTIGKAATKRTLSFARRTFTDTNEPILTILNNVVSEYETLSRLFVARDDIACLLHCVVLNSDRFSAIDLYKVRDVCGVIFNQVQYQVVTDPNPVSCLALVLVVATQNIKTAGGVSHDVIRDLDVFDRTPRCFSILITNRYHERGRKDLALDQVSIDYNSSGVL